MAINALKQNLYPSVDPGQDQCSFSIQLPDAVLERSNKILNATIPPHISDPVEQLRYQLNHHNGSSQILQAGIRKDFPSLTACRCQLVSDRARSFLQFASLEKVREIYTDKMQQITIVSIGAGGCLQEAELLIRLRQAGYQHIRFMLIDPSPATNLAAKALQKLDTRVEVVCFKNLDDYAAAAKAAPEQRASLVLLIDLQSTTPNGNGYVNESNQNNLTQHSFHFLRDNNMLQHNETVISFTEAFHTALSGIYTHETKQLNELQNPSDWSKHKKAAQFPIDA